MSTYLWPDLSKPILTKFTRNIWLYLGQHVYAREAIVKINPYSAKSLKIGYKDLNKVGRGLLNDLRNAYATLSPEMCPFFLTFSSASKLLIFSGHVWPTYYMLCTRNCFETSLILAKNYRK